MKPRSRPSACPSAAEPAPPRTARRRDEGYALVVLLMLATIMLIGLTAALPSVYTQGQREREEELIFRGNEYARAIAMFRRQFRRFPSDIKELKQTNGMRFLRREYADPMTRKGKWRFIHADASGTPIDSRTITRPKTTQPLGDSRSSSGGSSVLGGDSEQEKKDQEAVTEEGETKEKSSFFGDGKQLQGAFIIGVASMSNKKSIRVYNNKSRYSDWEFLGIEMGTGGVVPGQGGGIPGSQQQGGRGSGSFGPRGGGGFPMMPPLTDQ
jgi:type II secretory pathway pseudopilin PulG